MAQRIHTKHFGTLDFVRTFPVHNGCHIGLLTNGAYAHIGGLPVTKRDDLLSTIPEGLEQKDALDWFDNRDARAAQLRLLPSRRITYYPEDQSWRYVDTGLPVDSVQDLYEGLKGSPALDGAIKWFVGHTQSDTDATEDMSGFSVDEKIIMYLGKAQGEGQSVTDLGHHLEIDPKELIPIVKSMVEQSRIAQVNKRFYLPGIPPQVPANVGG